MSIYPWIRAKIAAAAVVSVTAFALEPATAEPDPMVQTSATSRPLCLSICAVLPIPIICEACCPLRPVTTPSVMWTPCLWVLGPTTLGIHGWVPTPGINQLATCQCDIKD